MRIIIRMNLLHAVILRRVIHQNQLTPLKLPVNRLHHRIKKWSNLLLTVLHIGNDGNKFRFCHNTFYFLVIDCLETRSQIRASSPKSMMWRRLIITSRSLPIRSNQPAQLSPQLEALNTFSGSFSPSGKCLWYRPFLSHHQDPSRSSGSQ